MTREIPEILDEEETAIILYARQVNDMTAINNFNYIWQKILLVNADPTVKKFSNKDLAAELGISVGTVEKIKRSKKFNAQLVEFIRHIWLIEGHGEILSEAIRQLEQAVQRGERWAIEKVLQLHEIEAKKERTIKPVSYEEAFAFTVVTSDSKDENK